MADEKRPEQPTRDRASFASGRLGSAPRSSIAALTLAEAHSLVTDEERERSFLLTDATAEDNPIVFANEAFLRLTGYWRHEVLGRNCRFLQGKDTDPAAVAALHEAIERAEPITVDVVNYKKDGTPFWNRLRIRPITDGLGNVVNFVGIQNEVAAEDVHSVPRRGIQP